jgi:O-acetyl-ADP-ribose deacetylase (regulator of RNase III)
MAIESTEGDLLNATVEALVNTVNTHGVMGKGLALQVKRAFPGVFEDYRRACRDGQVAIGRMHVVERVGSPRYVINFPTKREWWKPSELEFIETGLRDLVSEVQRRGIRSIAVPPLGCGLGGLDWRVVRPLIMQAFGNRSASRVLPARLTAIYVAGEWTKSSSSTAFRKTLAARRC